MHRLREILLVEDNPEDVRLIEEALENNRQRPRIILLRDGEEAMAYLRRQEPHSKARRPDLVLLDLNLPGRDACDVLQDIKADPHLRRIPVVVLAASQSESDFARCYDLHANACVSKPAARGELLDAVRVIGDFWLQTAVLPPG